MDRNKLISELVGQAYPTAIPLAGGRLRRHWVVRTIGVVPPEDRLRTIGEALEGGAVSKIQAAYQSAAGPFLSETPPSVRLVRIDEHHLVVETDFAEPEKSVGDAAAISQWGVLQDLDRELPVDDLQGLPSEHWFPLRAARKAAPRPYGVPDKELVFEFFHAFSRFEYALKRAGFLKHTAVGEQALPNWDVFANAISPKWAVVKDDPFKAACTYFSANAPKHQVVEAGGLDWDETKRNRGEHDAAFVLRCVRVVRNNLFHGGKFSDEEVVSAERDTTLLQHALSVLGTARTLHTNIAQFYAAEP